MFQHCTGLRDLTDQSAASSNAAATEIEGESGQFYNKEKTAAVVPASSVASSIDEEGCDISRTAGKSESSTTPRSPIPDQASAFSFINDAPSMSSKELTSSVGNAIAEGHSTSSQHTEMYRTQLVALFQKYNPAKVADVDKLLEK
jgi:hypothetical protein